MRTAIQIVIVIHVLPVQLKEQKGTESSFHFPASWKYFQSVFDVHIWDKKTSIDLKAIDSGDD